MKRILTLAMAVALALGCRSQQFYDSSRPERLLEINPHVGVGISSLVQNYGSAINGLSDFLLSPGCKVAFGLDVRFVIRNSLALGTGLEYGINNSRFAMNLLDNNTGSISSIYAQNHFYDLAVPVYLSWRFNIGSRVAWNVDLGAYFAKGTGGKQRLSGYTSGVNSLNQPVVSHASYKTNYFNSGQPFINKVKDFDWGPRLATGLIYDHKYNLNAVFTLSAPNLSSNQGPINAKYRNIALLFQFGYIF